MASAFETSHEQSKMVEVSAMLRQIKEAPPLNPPLYQETGHCWVGHIFIETQVTSHVLMKLLYLSGMMSARDAYWTKGQPNFMHDPRVSRLHISP